MNNETGLEYMLSDHFDAVAEINLSDGQTDYMVFTRSANYLLQKDGGYETNILHLIKHLKSCDDRSNLSLINTVERLRSFSSRKQVINYQVPVFISGAERTVLIGFYRRRGERRCVFTLRDITAPIKQASEPCAKRIRELVQKLDEVMTEMEFKTSKYVSLVCCIGSAFSYNIETGDFHFVSGNPLIPENERFQSVKNIGKIFQALKVISDEDIGKVKSLVIGKSNNEILHMNPLTFYSILDLSENVLEKIISDPSITGDFKAYRVTTKLSRDLNGVHNTLIGAITAV